MEMEHVTGNEISQGKQCELDIYIYIYKGIKCNVILIGGVLVLRSNIRRGNYQETRLFPMFSDEWECIH